MQHYRKMSNSGTLADRLSQTAAQGSQWREIYDRVVAQLGAAGVGANAPDVGAPFPEFALPDPRGQHHTLADLLGGTPLVLSFNRGAWCPYCRHELEAWSDRLPALAERGVGFVAVSAEVGGRAAALEAIFTDAMIMLCDVDHGLAMELGLAFYLGAPLIRRYREHGLDLAEIYGSASGLMPVPATFVIDAERIVRFAFVDPDFRHRADPDAVIAALDAL